ncbi:MAG: plastocyanin/azurin family copper-binding protein [Candidatus Nitrosocosmicus sp.]|nr:plastocyanin/azurin family copper-binding protein [Candidatus Nitrosocosmicus sp.]
MKETIIIRQVTLEISIPFLVSIFCLTLTDTSTAFAQQSNSNSTSQNFNNNNLTTSSSTKVNVSIPSGASFLTETAYDPNPVEITIGQTVLWTNDDSAFHTVTSGQPRESDSGQLFDSGLTGSSAMMSKGITFKHTFNVVGEYLYHCILHPGMVGTVIVR